MSHHKTSPFISGTLVFSGKKILLKHRENSYFVRFGREKSEYIHGDKVRARIRHGTTGTLKEVEILSLEKRSNEILIAEYRIYGEKKILSIIRELGRLEYEYRGEANYSHGTLLLIRFGIDGVPRILSVFAEGDTFDREEKILFYTAGIDIEFERSIENEAKKIQQNKPQILEHAKKKRTDFRSKFVFTIDGADAKDLDDAISIERDMDGNYLLSVHIADVAEYISEDSQLDREALRRGTSTYTPGKVVPMLPEEISNDLCSLHPGEPKLVLSCIMTIDRHGRVKNTQLVEGIINSAHRGVYEEIQNNYELLIRNYEGGNKKANSNIRGFGGGNLSKNSSIKNTIGEEFSSGEENRIIDEQSEGGASFSSPNAFGTFGSKSTEIGLENLRQALSLSYELYDILKKRREKEGKIIFESSEMYFEFGESRVGEKIIPKNIKNRSRVAAHMLIEEFMVLANEEVAKWCQKMQIPFLSRVHSLPAYNSMETIRQILSKGGNSEFCHSEVRGTCSTKKNTGSADIYRQHDRNSKNSQKVLEPLHIRRFLDALHPDELYKYSRLLLPRMAKAEYRDKKDRHFGLALEYYSHFTSPIRRYPDLQLHRIIKEKLQGKLDNKRILHYAKILKKVARLSSERERAAEDIERAFDSLYACRYMANHVGEIYSGRVSGIAEFAYFVELDSGVEVTIYLPRFGGYRTDEVSGTLVDKYGRIIVTIGDKRSVKITDILENERRIIGEVN